MTCICDKDYVPNDPTWTTIDIEVAFDNICGDGTVDPEEECDQGSNNTDDVIYGLPCALPDYRTQTKCDTSCHTFWDCVPN
ncbi:MAG TPA: hypothetical protein VFV19_13580 [Candidatus Polarisedimenticolaceae bacterium]|nr:hypothetical protein [Candidatus Polarisedimenticolaceae bacterium]